MLLVEDWMTEELVTLDPEASVADALGLVEDRHIRHIPILDDGHLVGIVSDRDLQNVSPTWADPDWDVDPQKMRVGDVMNRDVITADPQDQIGYVAQEMYKHTIESMPVMSEEEMVGLVTSSDVMRALVMLTGAFETGSQIAVQVPDKPGILLKLANNIEDLGEDIVSILASQEKLAGYRTLVFRLATTDPSNVATSLERDGYAVDWTRAQDTRGS